MRLNRLTKKIDRASPVHHELGFSMVELMIVCVILVIISLIAIPNIVQMNNNYKLDAAGHSVASLVQQARMQAVQTNLPAYANTTTGSPNMAFVASSPTAAYAAGNPDVALSPSITFQPAPGTSGFHSQLDTYLGGGTPLSGSIGFNARGLPCVASVTNPAVCTATTAGFEWFMQSNAGWEAVTVTPAGRIKSWRLTSQSNGTYSWQ
jgi:Tfp pilus assembly protein FimT